MNTTNNANQWLDQVRWNEKGLVTAIAQDLTSHRVLMVAWMNREALQQTAQRGEAVYFSRSRQKLWHKGEESGHIQKVHEIRLDCDGDVILLKVSQQGGIACHTGRESCLYLKLSAQPGSVWSWQAVDPVLKDPKSIYTDPDSNNQ